MGTEKIKVWVVEDDTMFRGELVDALRGQRELDCPADFSSYEAMLEHAEEGRAWPDVVLMDIELVGGSGLDGIRVLSKKAPEVKTLVLTVFSSREKLLDAIDAGASGYLLKRSSIAEIVRGIQDVLAGETVLDNQVIKYILDNATRKVAAELKLAPKEKDVIRHLSRGLTALQVSDEMGISIHTVDTYIRRIYKKMGVHSQSAAIARAARDNLL